MHPNNVENGLFLIKSAKVTKAPMMGILGNGVAQSGQQTAQLRDDSEVTGQSAVRDAGVRVSPDKVSRDSGVFSPSDAASMATESSDNTDFTATKIVDQPVNGIKCDAQSSGGRSVMMTPPVKAELVTNELDHENHDGMKPPPYHIAAAKSKYVTDFVQKTASYQEEQHFYENQVRLLISWLLAVHF